jgi:hypothetical protein
MNKPANHEIDEQFAAFLADAYPPRTVAERFFSESDMRRAFGNGWASAVIQTADAVAQDLATKTRALAELQVKHDTQTQNVTWLNGEYEKLRNTLADREAECERLRACKDHRANLPIPVIACAECVACLKLNLKYATDNLTDRFKEYDTLRAQLAERDREIVGLRRDGETWKSLHAKEDERNKRLELEAIEKNRRLSACEPVVELVGRIGDCECSEDPERCVAVARLMKAVREMKQP